jgi:UvrD-like helicase C-terminal domain
MSLLARICSLESQKKLMSKNLLFPIENVLRQLERGSLSPSQAQIQILDLVEFGANKEKMENRIELQAKPKELEKPKISFVSDDDDYKQSKDCKDSISSMFDFYLKPQTGGNISFQPFGNLGSNTSIIPTWSVPITNWSKVSQLNDCVVLYRTHSQSRSLEEIFLKAKVPYRLVSGTRFLDRKEIKDIMAILRYMANGADRISLTRFLPLVLDGVGAKTLEKMLAFLEDPDYPLMPKHQMMIVDLFTNIHTAWSQATNKKSLIDLCKELQIVTGYTKYLKKEYPQKEDYQERLENIGEIYSLMLPFDQDESMDLAEKLSAFLAQVALMSMVDNTANDPDQPKINLMSLHQSKGLEYETVFLVGCEDGLLPHQNSFMERSGMEEEVRLAYVGVTRAKQNLFLISADSRITFGQIKANPVSRIFRPFLDKYCMRSK